MNAALRVVPLLLLPVLLGCWGYVSTEAERRFQQRREGFSVTVCPVNIARRGHGTAGDPRLGRELADWLNAQGLATATFVRPGVPIPVRWHANQARMAQESARAFAAWVQQAGITTDYVLLAEILCSGDGTKVLGVHFYLAERSGLLAAGSLSNSHWEEFQRIRPADRAGGLAVLKELLRKRLPAPGRAPPPP